MKLYRLRCGILGPEDTELPGCGVLDQDRAMTETSPKRIERGEDEYLTSQL